MGKKMFRSAKFVLTILLLVTPVLAQADDVSTDSLGGVIERTADSAGYDVPDDSKNAFAALVGSIANVFISLIGIIFISYTIYGGYLWMTAAGSEEKVTKAKHIIRDGIIGIIIVLAAASIYYFVKGALGLSTSSTS